MKLQNSLLLQSSSPSTLSFLYSSPKSNKWGHKNPNFICKLVLFSPKKLRSQYFEKNDSKGHSSIQPCCCSSRFGEEQFDGEGIERGENEGSCAIFGSKDSIFPSKFESLEPSLLGIEPEPPYWPEREVISWAHIEQKAKSFGLPLSLRMMQKKYQWESGRFKDLKATNSCTSKAFNSMVFIIVELQTYALHMRESMCNEDLEMIIDKVQGDMYASFVCLFRQVFSQTPMLMMYVMILLANFSVHSASGENCDQTYLKVHYPDIVPQDESKVVWSDEEKELWDSIQDETLNMRGLKGIGFDHEVMSKFVSPLSVEIEPDNSVDYYKADLVYQMNLTHEPNNTLLLCNYAHFLKVFVRDNNRAEECFKRAVQVEPPDAEALCQYAIFLWKVKNDLWGAEERYQQAVAAEPRNSYYRCTYANFLWSTGGEETCFLPSSTSPINNKKGEEV
ncbi:uncharacterized protein [Solanum tuberosum]|uniref:Binding protein n=1 Tax=Solanum tuberosum TaxID=4113 RepID=M1CL32_SOLTU|nr:PREDICTED: uncharacterized protein LOC102586406 [Solanum tuberosum]